MESIWGFQLAAGAYWRRFIDSNACCQTPSQTWRASILLSFGNCKYIKQRNHHNIEKPPLIFLCLYTQKMAENNSMESVRKWVVEHKLRTVGKLFVVLNLDCWYGLSYVNQLFWFLVFVEGCLWLSGIAGSIAYNWSQPHMKTSVKIIHAR